MSATIITVFLIVLTLLLTLNLLATLRIIKFLRTLPSPHKTPEPIPEGATIPQLQARMLEDERLFDNERVADEAKVLLFLSPYCPKCKTKLAELDGLAQRARGKGVSLWLVTDEKRRKFKAFLSKTRLAQNSLMLDKKVLKTLNPTGLSPAYMFIDQQNVLQAKGMIGDENWATFSKQITEADEEIN